MSGDTSYSKILFLVWDRQSIRANGISKHLGASLHFLTTSRFRHPILFIRTLKLLGKERPRIIICQSPPITCAFIAMIYKYLLAWRSKPKIVIDAHTGAISRPWSKNISRIIMKRASVNIVINEEQQNNLIQNYKIAPVIVLEDPIPDFTDILLSSVKKGQYKIEPKAIFKVAVISSFAYDEPLEKVFDAAFEMPEVHFYITGDNKKLDKHLIKKADNVILTGFLDYSTYIDLLQKVNVIMDLTTDSTSMMAGAYEAVSLGQPLVISNWPPLRRYFNKGTVHTDNSSEGIRKAIMTALTKQEELSREMQELKIERTKEWKEKISKLNHLFK